MFPRMEAFCFSTNVSFFYGFFSSFSLLICPVTYSVLSSQIYHSSWPPFSFSFVVLPTLYWLAYCCEAYLEKVLYPELAIQKIQKHLLLLTLLA